VSPLSMWGTAHPPVPFTRGREREPQCTWARPDGQERCAGFGQAGANGRLETSPCVRGLPGPREPRCEHDQKGVV
jgi:hypothetical protein